MANQINYRVLIADAMSDKAKSILEEAGLQVDVNTGKSEEDLCKIIGNYHGLVVRSATTVTAKIIEAGKNLRVIGRAGVGVDNIDLKAATKAGVVVMNTPHGNITSAGEHAVALLFSLARNITRADVEMKKGKWPKKGLTGVELTGKVLGIVGLGKVGGIMASVGKALEMRILVYDPFLTDAKASDLGVIKCELDDLLKTSDFISIHTPLTPQTKGLIDKVALAKMKKSARLINAARGGIVVEADLVEALRNGTIAGAALDVFETEPLPEDSPLNKLENIVLTPHLGASTEEAQERVAEDIARQFVELLKTGCIRNAVNISIRLNPKISNWADLAETMGRMTGQLVQKPVRELKVGIYGKLAEEESKELGLMALKGLLARSCETVTLVNVSDLAEAHGTILSENRSTSASDFRSLLTVTAETGSGTHTLCGTCFDDKEGRIVRIDDLSIDLKPAQRMLVVFYPDRPGMIGQFGSILGAADINIASMAVGRREKRGQAAVVLTLDDPVPPDVLEQIRTAIKPEEQYYVEL